MADPITTLAPIEPPKVEQVTANQSTVGKESTVAGQMDGLLKQDSGYMNLARQQGKNQAAGRGLLNSSLAAGSSMAAATQAALPIAQQDASTQFTNMRDNEARTFTANQQNAQAGNTSNNLAFDVNSRGKLTDQAFAQQQTLNTQNAAIQTARDAAQLGHQQTLNQQQSDLTKAQDAWRLTQQKELNTQNFTQEKEMQAIKGQQSVDLANIEANYKNLLQTNASAQEMWKSYNDSVSKLVENKDLTATHVKNALQIEKDSFTAGLALLGAVSQLNLKPYAIGAPVANVASTGPGGFVSTTQPAPPAYNWDGINISLPSL